MTTLMIETEKSRSLAPTPLSADGKRILPDRPPGGEELIHHVFTAATFRIKKGQLAQGARLMESVLEMQTRYRYIYHAMAAFYLSLLYRSEDRPDTDLLRQALETNPMFPHALELCLEHDREWGDELVTRKTRLAGLDLEGFALVMGCGVWKDINLFRHGDDWFAGKTVFDFGARTGFHALAFLAAGAASYTAVDKAEKSFRLARVKNHLKLNHPMTDLPFRMVDLARDNKKLLTLKRKEGTEYADRKRYDFVGLFATSEHLHDPAAVFALLEKLLAPSGRLMMSHHNFYSWNGHHNSPKSERQLKEMRAAGEDLSFADWQFFDKEITNDYLNRLTIAELRAVLDEHLDVVRWEREYTPIGKGLGRYGPEIARQHRERGLTPEDLLTQRVLAEATKRDTGLCGRFADWWDRRKSRAQGRANRRRKSA
ncbi:MAG: methyltransferase domain-containing protein [Sumerlaeia bacterium]